MYKVLVSDNISQKGIDILKEEAEVTFNTELSREKFLDIIGEYDALIVRSMTELDKEALKKAHKLKVIGRAGTGYDNIDIDEATRRGIMVFNTPTGNTISAVEHTMGMILAVSRNIAQANEIIHRGIWDRKKYMGVELKGKTLGIIGLGRIGSRVAVRAQAFGMKVIANDPYLPPENAASINVPLLGFKEVLRKSDYISLHTPLTDETYHILSHKEFAIMEEDVRIINCARGKNIDTEALAKAVEEGKVNGAAIDVHEIEPIPEDNPLLKFKDRVIMTCHLGGTTTEAMDNVSIAAAEQVLDVLNNGLPESPLNISSINIREYNDAKPYFHMVKKLGGFLVNWKGHERIIKIEAEYGGEVANQDLKPFTISLVKDIFDPILDSRVNLVNALLVAEERSIDIKTSHIRQPDGLNNIIRVRIKTNKGEYSIAGTSLPIGPRIIEINEFRIDLNLDGKFLIISYQDKPGIIGMVGTLLGKNNINIATMQVGRKELGGQAIMIIQTDSKPSAETMGNIKNEINLSEISYLEV